MTPAAIESALQAWRPATVTRPGDFAHFLASSFYRSLVGEVRPEVRAVTSIALGPLEDAAEHVSVTLPTPWSPVIVLSPAAVADAVTECATLAHEWTHVGQLARAGRVQGAVDYTSGELRAQREADAYAAGLWLRYVLTGALPDAAPALSSLYHLDAGDAALATAIIASHLDTIRAGALPPLDVCVILARHVAAHGSGEERARLPAVLP